MDAMPYEKRRRDDYAGLLREASQFYNSRGDVYTTLRKLAERLEREHISYALIGGMALAAHGFVRMTQAVDILLTLEGLASFNERCVGRGYAPAFPGARKMFRDTETQVRIEIITTGDFPGDGKRKPVAFPDPTVASIERDGLQVVGLEKLIELKLASGISAPHRMRDLADAQDLIAALNLPDDFANRFDPSVRAIFHQLWGAAQESDRSNGTTHK